MNRPFFAKIVKVDASELEFVVNKGSDDGVRESSEFVIIEVGDEVIDPDTNQSLGNLEIVKGKVKVKHIQEKMTTLISNEFRYEPDRKEIRKSNLGTSASRLLASSLIGRDADLEIVIPGGKTIKAIEGVKVGDYIKKTF